MELYFGLQFGRDARVFDPDFIYIEINDPFYELSIFHYNGRALFGIGYKGWTKWRLKLQLFWINIF